MLVGVIYYFTLKNNSVHDKYVNEMMNHNNFKKNALNHITNSLLEIDYLNGKNGNLGSNENSTCYKKDGSIIKNCRCHGSCKTCGYGDMPNGINQCLKCKNGTKVNKLYNNGAGWCSMITNDEVSNDYSFSKNEASAVDNSNMSPTTVPATTTVPAKGKIKMTCNQRFMNMCAASSNWGECLEKNKKSLLLSGCNIELDKSQVSDSSTAKNIGMVKKTKLDQNDNKLLANHFLQSENSQHKLQITNNGRLIIKSGATTNWESSGTEYPVTKGPYHLTLNNDMSLVLANAKGTTVWSINPSCPSTTEPCYGPNVKVILTNSGNLQIKDNSNIVRWSSVPKI